MNELAISIAVILLPGLIASVICDKIVVHMVRWDAFKYSIYSFIFGVASYILLQFIFYILAAFFRLFPSCHYEIISTLSVWSIIQNQKQTIVLSEVAFATAISPLVAIAAAWLVNYKILNKISQKIRVSSKFGDENLFSFFLNSKEVNWVYLRDKSASLSYCGQVVSYSECEKIQEIVLSNVKVFDYETSDELYEVSLIYLSNPLGKLVIEVPMITTEKKSHDNEEAD